MQWTLDDPGFQAVRTASLTSGLVAIKALDSENGEGIDGDFGVTSFTRNEPLREAMTLKLAKFRQWVTPTT